MLNRSIALVMLVLFAAGCVDPGTDMDQVEVQVFGQAFVGSDAASGRIPLDAASIGLPPSDPQAHLAVTLAINGSWLESGGAFCEDSDPIWISNSINLTIDADGKFTASGIIPLQWKASSDGHAPGCKTRTGINVESFQEITLEAIIPLKPWDSLQVWMGCQTQAYTSCNGNSDPNCVSNQTRACRDSAWEQTLWHRVTGAQCISNGSYYCLEDPEHPGSVPSGVRTKLTISADALRAINAEFNASRRLVISSDLIFEFRN